MTGLTRRQAKLLRFIRAHAAEHGFLPSLDDMRARMGLAAISNIYDFLNRIERRGHIRRIPGYARAIELIEVDPAPLPPDVTAAVIDAAQRMRMTPVDAIAEMLRRYLHLPVPFSSVSRGGPATAGDAIRNVPSPAAPLRHDAGSVVTPDTAPTI